MMGQCSASCDLDTSYLCIHAVFKHPLVQCSTRRFDARWGELLAGADYFLGLFLCFFTLVSALINPCLDLDKRESVCERARERRELVIDHIHGANNHSTIPWCN